MRRLSSSFMGGETFSSLHSQRVPPHLFILSGDDALEDFSGDDDPENLEPQGVPPPPPPPHSSVHTFWRCCLEKPRIARSVPHIFSGAKILLSTCVGLPRLFWSGFSNDFSKEAFRRSWFKNLYPKTLRTTVSDLFLFGEELKPKVLRNA